MMMKFLAIAFILGQALARPGPGGMPPWLFNPAWFAPDPTVGEASDTLARPGAGGMPPWGGFNNPFMSFWFPPAQESTEGAAASKPMWPPGMAFGLMNKQLGMARKDASKKCKTAQKELKTKIEGVKNEDPATSCHEEVLAVVNAFPSDAFDKCKNKDVYSSKKNEIWLSMYNIKNLNQDLADISTSSEECIENVMKDCDEKIETARNCEVPT